jgi:hypothetical protein
MDTATTDVSISVSTAVATRERFIADKILLPFDAGKFYRLDSDVMGKTLGVSYHDLAQSRFTPESGSSLSDVLAKGYALVCALKAAAAKTVPASTTLLLLG